MLTTRRLPCLAMRRRNQPSENIDTTFDTGSGIIYANLGESIGGANGPLPTTSGIAAQPPKVKGVQGVRVNSGRCRHQLSHASYNDRIDLSNCLDDNGIDILIKRLVSSEDYIKIWQFCHGGTDPAMGLLFHLSSTKATTLQELWAVASSCGFKDVSELIEKEFKSSPSIADQMLDKQNLRFLNTIAEMISDSPYMPKGRVPWKIIASAMGLSLSVIRNLDAPATRGSNERSLTMAFISHLNMRYPSTKVAMIAQGLVDMGRTDALQEDMFSKCREDGCIMF